MSKNNIETFDNAYPDRDYVININCYEFTSVCPKTGQPDFGTIHIQYTPDKKCIELKSLKMYLFGFRNEGIFYEMVINRILDDLVEACQPRWMEVKGDFNIRGGIDTIVTASYKKEQ
ncbi:NADPH-dependent 7-cyano-7-deazaguanine reductase QueF [bacterium]|nr:NADPH-dependent 7-cyano-7-deazaguanine reductase QueF [bacterium]